MTTNPATIVKAFHPIDNPTGEKWLRKAKPEEGFSGPAAIFINDAKYISPGRVIDCGPIIDPAALTEMYEQLFRISLPELHTAREKLIEDLDKLKEEKAELEKEKAMLELKIMELSK